MSELKKIDLVSQQLDLAIVRFEQERYDESNNLLFRICEDEEPSSYSLFCIGRNYLYMRKSSDAEHFFELSTKSAPVFRWVHYEYARLLMQEGRKTEAASRMITFCESYTIEGVPRLWNEIHTDSILQIAHACFDEDREGAAALYRWLSLVGVRDYLCELRIIEQALHDRMYEDAAARMRDLQSKYMLDAWGMFALAKVYLKTERVADVEPTILAAIETDRGNRMLKIFAAHRFLEFGLVEEANRFYTGVLIPESEQSPIIAAEIGQIRFRIAVLRRDHSTLQVISSSNPALSSLPNWLVVEALFAFALPGEQITKLDLELCIVLASFLELQQPYTLGTVLSLYQFYSRRRMWDAVAQLDLRISSTDLEKHPEVVMRRFESFCAQSRIQDAKELYSTYYAPKDLSQWEACVVLRFLAEVKEWPKAAELLCNFLGKGYYFPDGDFFLLKICRQTGIHTRVIEIIESLGLESLPAELAGFKRVAMDDLALRKETGSQISPENKLLKQRRHSNESRRNVGYFCTDKAYFLSVLTLMVSIVINSVEEGNLIDWYLFLAKDVPASWYDIVSQLAAVFNVGLTIVAEGEIIDSEAIHMESYGIFTGGNTLSRAAFLRIYAAKYLFDLQIYERALYADSDIIALSSIADLFAMPFNGSLLMVRAEEPSPEVQDVATSHGLSEKEYFNSGVLLFDLTRDDTYQAILKAVNLSEKEPERLMFHDQCALNIAFKGKTMLLRPEWNYFLRPHRPDNGDYSNAKFLHFLDKPKPWDVSYSREYRSIWLMNLAVVRAILGVHEFREIVLAANS